MEHVFLTNGICRLLPGLSDVIRFTFQMVRHSWLQDGNFADTVDTYLPGVVPDIPTNPQFLVKIKLKSCFRATKSKSLVMATVKIV